MRDRELYCDVCRVDMLFETPPCADGHGVECPELACTGCGSAALVAVVVAGTAVGAPRLRGTDVTRGGPQSSW